MMKFLKLTLVTAAILVATSTQAVTYKFIAKDNSAETKICVLAGSNEKTKLKRMIRRYSNTNRFTTNPRYIANYISCNDMVIASFASRYHADDVASYLNRYTLPKNKTMETDVTIKDIASLSKRYDLPDKVITVYVGQ